MPAGGRPIPEAEAPAPEQPAPEALPAGNRAAERPAEDGRAEDGPAEDGPAPDWAGLRLAADGAAARAYAPYSGLRVGAAGLCEDGHVVTGCNVENASFGLTLCAECGLVSALVASGCARLLAVSVAAGDGQPLTPCGRCRQLLMEHGGPELLLDGGPGATPQRLGQLLPGAFDHAELVSRRSTAPPGAPPLPEAPPPPGQPSRLDKPGAER